MTASKSPIKAQKRNEREKKVRLRRKRPDHSISPSQEGSKLRAINRDKGRGKERE